MNNHKKPGQYTLLRRILAFVCAPAVFRCSIFRSLQQSSDITYRVYDYGRLVDGKPRELHIDKSIDVITVPAARIEDTITPQHSPVLLSGIS